jgi:hypothetical protein
LTDTQIIFILAAMRETPAAMRETGSRHWGFRQVLRAYPKGLRRDEMLDTLMLAGTALTWRAVANLVWHGLRARLGRPLSRMVVVTALLVALTTGYLAAAVSDRLAWEAVPDYPAGAELAEITGTVFPGLTLEGGRDEGKVFTDPAGEHDGLEPFNEDFGFAGYHFWPAGMSVKGDYGTWVRAAEQRLIDAGWTIREDYSTGATDTATGELDPSGRDLVAERGPLSLHLETSFNVVDTPAGEFWASAGLNRWQPGWVIALDLACWLLGGLAGWLVFGWASRRTEAVGFSALFPSATALTFGLLFLTPLTVLGMIAFPLAALREHTPHQPFWAWSVAWGYGCNLLGLVLLLTALGVAAAARPSREPLEVDGLS